MTKKLEQVQYDEENDVLYVLLNDSHVVRTVSLDDLRLVDYDDKNQPAGVEFISASDGLDLTGVPGAGRIQTLLHQARIEFPVRVDAA